MTAEDTLANIRQFCIDQRRWPDNDIVTQQLIEEILFMIHEWEVLR